MRLRLFPIVLFAGGLLLTVKMGGLWQEITVDAGRQSLAETASAPAAEPAEVEPAVAGGTTEPGYATAAGAETPGAPSAAGEDLLANASAAPQPVDPLSYTDVELELLQSLAKRRDELQVREKELAERQALAAAAERRIDDKLEQLQQLQGVIEGLVKQHDEEREAQLDSLVKIYENMKPKDAAQIFENLDLDVLLDVIERMKERKIAPVLALMDPAKAQEVTIELAQRRALPLPL